MKFNAVFTGFHHTAAQDGTPIHRIFTVFYISCHSQPTKKGARGIHGNTCKKSKER
jgi:hypothetical protein